jgi:hypothetical protein
MVFEITALPGLTSHVSFFAAFFHSQYCNVNYSCRFLPHFVLSFTQGFSFLFQPIKVVCTFLQIKFCDLVCAELCPNGFVSSIFLDVLFYL